MRKKDYYEILGVARDADSGEIKFAYRQLALRNHPDTNRDDLFLTSHEAVTGAERDIRLHTGRGVLVFTKSIPAGVEQGTLLRLDHALGDGRKIELIFRVRIAE